MNKQEHIKALEAEIEDNISVLIDHCMAGHLNDSRLVAACLRGTRNKLKQVRKSAAYEITQIDYKLNGKSSSRGVDVASNAVIVLMWAIGIVSLLAVGIWFYSLGLSV